MATWYLALNLKGWFGWLDATWPGRDRRSDGTIGDLNHVGRVSDHNPDPSSSPPGCVDAADNDSDGVHVPSVLANAFLDPATHYVIHRGRIWDADDKFRPHAYTGSNWHGGHIHRSIRKSEAARDLVFVTATFWLGAELVDLGQTGLRVRHLQALLNGQGASLGIDGDFGPRTDAALRAFQTWAGIASDGIAGPITYRALTTRTRGW
jgi:hypothetical protein